MIAFSDQRHKTLAAIHFRLGGLSAMPSPDTPALGITIIGEGKDSGPIRYFQLMWMSGIREANKKTEDRP